MPTQTLRTATLEDFKIGNTLITNTGYSLTIYSHYDTGVWEARGHSGCTCVFEREARFYQIAV
jgi:hypothetical protein